MSETNSLVIFSKAALMLAEANTVQQAKELMDMAITAGEWADRKKMGEESIQFCRRYALDAERKMAEIWTKTDKAKNRPGPGRGKAGVPASPALPGSPATLKELRVTPKQMSRAGELLALSEIVFEEIKGGEKTRTEVMADIKRKQRSEKIQKTLQHEVASAPPKIELCDAVKWLKRQEPADLLLTDPPYMTDVPDIHEFVKSWLPLALSKVKKTGRAFICIGAYPEELNAYLSTAMPAQVLVWTYRNTLGPSPKRGYKLNWQAILYYEMPDAPPIDCPVMLEQFSVQDINAPDGRLGDRYHAWQKPMELAERFIRHSTVAGATVIDPFCCTGTFVLAAAKLGRVGLGCDNNEKNLKIAYNRIGHE